MEATFESALEALYSHHQSVDKEAIQAAAARRTHTVSDLRTYLARIGGLSFPKHRLVHIAGTKGKGSTACLCESILRNAYNYRTGLFTSPHLVDIRERIRINGRPVSKAVFGKVYWELRKRLEANWGMFQEQGLPTLPGYFRMLTLMAFHIFAHYQPSLDVIILEVGMGGRYDATNIIDHTEWQEYACGVTLLDYDHVRVLGHRIEQIAWEKGGIFQNQKGSVEHVSLRPEDHDEEQLPDIPTPDGDCRYFALDTNQPSALHILYQCALVEGEGAPLRFVGAKNSTIPQDCSVGLAGAHQRMNAELALALCQAVAKDRTVSDDVIHKALAQASWPGRCQTVVQPNWTLRLDGAHTVESMSAGLEWYTKSACDGSKRILLFNCSHERNPVELLELLVPLDFVCVVFCHADAARPSMVDRKRAAEWLGLPVKDDSNEESWQDTLAKVWIHLCQYRKFLVIANVSVKSALEMLRTKYKDKELEILVTGSLYLVGSALDAVDWSESEAEGDVS